MMQRHRELPFGDEPTDEGVRFRLRAPSGSSIALQIQGVPAPRLSVAALACVDAPSEVVDPAEHLWSDPGWRGRRWEDIVFI
jgi:hypothetical protein